MRQRVGPCLAEYSLDSPPIEFDIHQSIGYRKNQKYVDLAFGLLSEETSTNSFGWCGKCGVPSIDGYNCELCFTEYETVNCPSCEEENYYESWEPQAGVEIVCGDCGAACKLD